MSCDSTYFYTSLSLTVSIYTVLERRVFEDTYPQGIRGLSSGRDLLTMILKLGNLRLKTEYHLLIKVVHSVLHLRQQTDYIGHSFWL